MTSACLPAFVLFLGAAPSASAETRGYVISLIHTATYGDVDACPQGGNGGNRETRERRFIAEGLSKEEAAKRASGDVQQDQLANNAVAGAPARPRPSPGNFPTSMPDPQIQTAQGRFAFGFNLDGRAEPGSFEDPDSHEQGVDNQMWRVLGCFTVYNVKRPVVPYNESIAWDTAIDAMPAWLMSVSGPDLSQDGEVTVTFDRALNILMRDTHGGALSGASYTIDTDPRSHSLLKGRIKNQVLTVDTGDFSMQGESQFYAVLRFSHTHLRLNMAPDGSLSGIIGGYQPWRDYFHYLAVRGEGTAQVDLSGVYYAMKRLADGVPDATGQNTGISAAYWLEAVPAFQTTLSGKVVSQAVGSGPARSGTALREAGGR